MLKKLHANRLTKLAHHIVDVKKRRHKVFDFGILNADVPDNVLAVNDDGSKVTTGGLLTIDAPVYHDDIGSKCGTNGCAIGECPYVFPKYWSMSRKTSCPRLRKSRRAVLYIRDIVGFFGVVSDHAHRLFFPGFGLEGYLDRRATAEDVSKHILEYVKTHTRKIAKP